MLQLPGTDSLCSSIVASSHQARTHTSLRFCYPRTLIQHNPSTVFSLLCTALCYDRRSVCSHNELLLHFVCLRSRMTDALRGQEAQCAEHIPFGELSPSHCTTALLLLLRTARGAQVREDPSPGCVARRMPPAASLMARRNVPHASLQQPNGIARCSPHVSCTTCRH